jgi:mannose-1-phosphate guanylyltransferase
MNNKTNEYAVIMAGGKGERLWPLSRYNNPKQLIRMFNNESLLELCIKRVKSIFSSKNIYIITNKNYRENIYLHTQDIPQENIIFEPVARNTANSIALAGSVVNKKDPNSTIVILSSDQLINPVDKFASSIKTSLDFINDSPEATIIMGIKPLSPHTGFGYIKKGMKTKNDVIFRVKNFTEKPDKKTAESYLSSQSYFWNSGTFIWKTSTLLKHMKKHLPDNHEKIETIIKQWGSPQQDKIMEEIFPQLSSISIDYGIVEKINNIYMSILDCEWMDVGSFHSLSENICITDDFNNRFLPGSVFENYNSKNNIIINTSETAITAIDIENMLIIQTPDILLLCPEHSANEIKKALMKIDKKFK